MARNSRFAFKVVSLRSETHVEPARVSTGEPVSFLLAHHLISDSERNEVWFMPLTLLTWRKQNQIDGPMERFQVPQALTNFLRTARNRGRLKSQTANKSLFH